MNQKKSQLKIGIVLNYVNMIVGNLIPVVYTPIMLGLLGQSEYGLYKLSSSVTSYLSLISMGLGSAITRYLIQTRAEEGKEAEEKILGLFVIIFNLIALLAILIGSVLVTHLDIWYGQTLDNTELRQMQILVALMALNMALGFSASPYISVVTSHERFLFNQGMNIISTCAVPILNILVLFLGAASTGMALVSLGMSATTRILYQIYIVRKMDIKPRFRQLPLYQMRSILAFSFWIFLSNIVGQLYNATDTVLIGMVPTLGTVGVAIYNVGIMLSNIIGGVSTGISALLSPTVNRMVFERATSEELTNLTIRVGRIQGIIASLLISGFVAFGRYFLKLYVGPGYEDAYWVAIWVAIPSLIYLVQSVCLSVLTAENKHQFRSIMYLFIAVLNVIGTWYLMKGAGIVGAAAMTGIATVIGHGFMMNWYYHEKTDINIPVFWKKILPIFIVPVCMTVGAGLVSMYVDFSNLTAFCVGVLVYTIIFAFLNWKFVMNPEEKALVSRGINGKRQ